MSSQHTLVSLRAHNPEIVDAFFEEGVDLRIRLSGSSMKPLLGSGSVLRFSARVTPRVGDIVLMSFPSGHDGSSRKLIAHRVIALDDERVWTKGDSSRAQDPPVPRARVLATATALETHATAVPLRNAAMRALGLALSSVYPHLVRAYRSVWPRKDAFGCAS